MPSTQSLLLRPDQGHSVSFQGFGARYMVGSEATSGAFALLEHPIAPKTLAAPLHTHAHEDEWSYVIEGEVGFQLDQHVFYASPGDLVSKPRGIPHAFWNRSDQPARVLELIAPPAFAAYFEEIAPLLPPNRLAPDFEALAAVMARYELTMDLESIPVISAREGLPLPPG